MRGIGKGQNGVSTNAIHTINSNHDIINHAINLYNNTNITRKGTNGVSTNGVTAFL